MTEMDELIDLFDRLSRVVNMLKTSVFCVGVKNEKNVIDEDGLTTFDKIMLHENGSAVQGIQATHEVENKFNQIISYKLEIVLNEILDNITNHGWDKNQVKNRMVMFCTDLENDLNVRISDEFKNTLSVIFK